MTYLCHQIWRQSISISVLFSMPETTLEYSSQFYDILVRYFDTVFHLIIDKGLCQIFVIEDGCFQTCRPRAIFP
uniref:Uncharacterized protein n=1 Tax=Lepeophtheirus salmonis TaxID=72036 RepID=A0A0K2TQ99_LEPSM